MKVWIRFCAFIFFLIFVLAVLFIILPEPKAGKINAKVPKTVDLSRVRFALGQYGGTLYTATSSDPKTFNLVMAHETSSTDAVSDLFEGLTEVNLKTLKIKGCLARSWKVLDRGKRWIFTLRKNVKWFDGKPFTADDVVFTYKKIYFNPRIPNSTKDTFLIDGKLPKVRKIDRYTVEFDLPEPFAPILYSLQAAIFPKHVLKPFVDKGKFMQVWNTSTPPRNLIGTGPYELVRYVPGQYLMYKRNPYYYKFDANGKRLPYIAQKITYILPDRSTQLLKFENGNIDIYDASSDDLPELLTSHGNYTVYNLGPSMSADFLCFNERKGTIPDWKWKLFTNVRFRRAISHAIDRKGIVLTIYNGLGYPEYSPVSISNKLYYDPTYPRFPYNLKKARKLLSEIGLKDRNGDGYLDTPDGHRVEFNLLTNSNNPSRVQVGAIIKSDLKTIGIKVHFQPLDFNNLVEKLLHSHDFDAVIIGLTSSIDPNGGRNVWMSSGELHMWNPCEKKPATEWEAEVDKLFNLAVKEVNFNKRVELYRKAYRIITNEQPLIYIVAPLEFEAVSNRLKNYYPTIYGIYKPERAFLVP